MSSAKSRVPARSQRARGDAKARLVEAFARFVPAWVRWNQSRTGALGGPSFSRLRLLGVLHYHGPRIMSELSHELGVTPRNVTALVDGLEKERLVARQAHPKDRRATLVRLTPAGTRICGALWADRLAAMAELFDDLTERDRNELGRLIERLSESLRRRGSSDEAPTGSELDATSPPVARTRRGC